MSSWEQQEWQLNILFTFFYIYYKIKRERYKKRLILEFEM